MSAIKTNLTSQDLPDDLKTLRHAIERGIPVGFNEHRKGVECRKDSGVIDEIPGAYKNIDSVMENSKELVRVVAQLKQIMCIKG